MDRSPPQPRPTGSASITGQRATPASTPAINDSKNKGGKKWDAVLRESRGAVWWNIFRSASSCTEVPLCGFMAASLKAKRSELIIRGKWASLQPVSSGEYWWCQQTIKILQCLSVNIHCFFLNGMTEYPVYGFEILGWNVLIGLRKLPLFFTWV